MRPVGLGSEQLHYSSS